MRGIMANIQSKQAVWSAGWLIVFSLFFLTSCAYDQQFMGVYEEIRVLNQRVAELQDQNAVLQDQNAALQAQNEDRMELDEDIQTQKDKEISANLEKMNSNNVALMMEFDQLKLELGEVAGRIDDAEFLIRSRVERDLENQDAQDAMQEMLAELPSLVSRVEQMERYLDLGANSIPGEGQGEGVSGQAASSALESPPPDEVEKQDTAPDILDPNIKEDELYEISLDLFKQDRFGEASAGFQRLVDDHPDSDIADNALFWIGECHMAQQHYEQAILVYHDVVNKYPNGNKVPNAIYRQAIAFLKLDDTISAKLLLGKLIERFPASEEARMAKDKLSQIE